VATILKRVVRRTAKVLLGFDEEVVSEADALAALQATEVDRRLRFPDEVRHSLHLHMEPHTLRGRGRQTRDWHLRSSGRAISTGAHGIARRVLSHRTAMDMPAARPRAPGRRGEPE